MLRDWLDSKLTDWQRQRQRQSQFDLNHNYQSNGTNGHGQEQVGFESFRVEAEQYRQHLSGAFEQWKVISDKKKQDTWLFECARAFTREQEKHKETKNELELAGHKMQLLRSQLSQTQYPSDISTYPPSTIPISLETANHLPPPDSLNYEALISKWKSRIQSQRSMQQPLPPSSPWATATPPNLNSNKSNGSAYPQAYRDDQRKHTNIDAEPPSDEDEDLADAPGDEDDLDQHRGMNKDVLDPSLRDGEADGEGQADGRMLMGLREYDGSGGGRATEGMVVERR